MSAEEPPLSRFGEITDQVHVSRRGRIEAALIESGVADVQDLRGVVRGRNNAEATDLLQRNIPGLTELDASALAGVLLTSSGID